MAIIGIDPSKVKNSINIISVNYKTAVYVLTEKNQSSFIDVMGTIWGSEQAVEFFKAYETDINQLLEEIKLVFQSVLDSMNSAAAGLTGLAGSSWTSDIDIGTYSPISVQNIKTNIDGVKGIDVEKASSTLSELESMSKTLENTLESTIVNIRNSGFVGGEMQISLESSLNSIKTKIETAFGQIKTSVNTAITDTINKYSTDASNISSAFSGGQSA